jgi:hypothetical protein
MIARPVSLATLAMSAFASLTGISMIIGMGLFILTHLLFILAGHSTYEFIKLGVCHPGRRHCFVVLCAANPS